MSVSHTVTVTTTNQPSITASQHGSSRSPSWRASPAPATEKPKLDSRKSSFVWSLRKSNSDCTLSDEHKHGWKPVTLTIPVLIPFAIMSLLLAAILEILAQESLRAGGLAMTSSPDDFSVYVTFGYLFLPTIIAVIYSLFWSWVDLDAKRMQPWFEMSREGGAVAKQSVLLAYPYDFVGTVPFTALKRRHWPVFCAGTTMVLIFWLVTPMQSAIFGTGLIMSTRALQLQHSTSFLPSIEQGMVLDQSVLNEGYAITWLNQPLPEFTAPNYTVMPFQEPKSSVHPASSNWTDVSTRYWTDLECWPANFTRQGEKARQTFIFDNGKGCNVREISPYGSPDGSVPYKMMYIGYQNSAYATYYLENENCTDEAAHQYLAVWSYYDAAADDIDIRASFCETSYYKQKVEVAVSARNQSIIEPAVVPLEAPQNLSEADFNITAFEYLVGAGVSIVELEPGVERDYPFGRALEQYFRVNDFNLSWPLSPMAGFAVGSQNVTTLDEFNDAAKLEESFRSSQQLIFSLALRQVMRNSSDLVTSEGQLALELHGVIVSRLFSAIVEGLLVLVAILCLCLAWFCHVAPSNLTEDPSSLGSLISICQNSPILLRELTGKGAFTEKDFSGAFSGQRFSLNCGCRSQSQQMVIEVHGDSSSPESLRIAYQESLFHKGHYTPVQPWALRRDVGALLLLVMMAALAALSYLKVQEQSLNGLDRPSASFEVLQLLLNYIPTIFATILEPFWVLVNRLLCILQPYRDLWAGQRHAKGSIRARYTSVPPQLVFWRAAGARHFLLVALSGIALLSNLLAVGLGGIFNELPVRVEISHQFQQSLTPRMTNDSIWDLDFVIKVDNGAVDFRYEDPFYVAMNNYSRGTPLPPWIGSTHFYQPFVVAEEETRSSPTAESYTALTRGFGVDASCSPAGSFRTRGDGPTINTTIVRNGAVVYECAGNYSAEALALNTERYEMPSGLSAAEVVDTPNTGTTIGLCDTSLIFGWARSSQTQDLNGEIDSSFVVCEPIFNTAMFEVTVDTEGYILDSVQKTESTTTMGYAESMNNTDSITVILNHILKKPNMRWHNDTLSRDWVNYLLKIQPGNAAILDPTSDLPDIDYLADSVGAIYTQLYAITLGLNTEVFDRSPRPLLIPGIEHRTETKIFMPNAAFVISTVVLGLNILTAFVLYAFAMKSFLPRMPTSIGSTVAYLAPSRAVREYSPDSHDDESRTTFSFGRYIGDDGRAHLGIEMDPFVVPVQLSSLKRGDTQPSTSRLRKAFTRRESSKSGDTWL